MDVSVNAMASAVIASRQDQAAEQVQIYVMKQAMDVQASSAATLLSGVTGALPLATSGSVGTQFNQMV